MDKSQNNTYTCCEFGYVIWKEIGFFLLHFN